MSICFIACDKINIDMSKYENVDYDLKCIWDKAPHCAFTSLIDYDGKYYCCFREANSHIPYRNGGYGVIRILESSDGDNWYSVCVIEDHNYDLRDPFMSITPDNRLMLLCGCEIVDQLDNLIVKPAKVCFFSSTQSIRDAEYDAYYINIEESQEYSSYWLWKVTWYNGVAYGCAYKNGLHPILVQSCDGINFNVITELQIMGNEADIEFVNDDMVIVCRPMDDVDKGFVCVSSFPYQDWDYRRTDYLIHCPDILFINNHRLLVAGRGVNGMTIFGLDDNLYPLKYLPSDGDAGYPSLIYDEYNQNIYVSYYTTISTTQIYMAKFFVQDLL